MRETTVKKKDLNHSNLPMLVGSKDDHNTRTAVVKQEWNYNQPPTKARSSSAKAFVVSRSNLANSLFQAVLTCKISKVKFLLKKGHVAANVKNDKGYNLLMTALYISEEIRRGHMFQCLLQLGVDCCYRNKETGGDVLALASFLGRAPEVRRILDAGMGEIDIQCPDKEGLTPLHLAVKQGHIDVVQLLVNVMNKFHLSVDVVDKQGLTPFIYAKRLGYNDIAQVLLKEGHACMYMKDQIKFRSADEWAIIGAKEQMKRQKQKLNKQVAYYRIRGMLPPINELRELKNKAPKIMFERDNSKFDQLVNKDKSASESVSSEDESPSLSTASHNDLTSLGQKAHEDKVGFQGSPRSKRVTSLLALNHQIHQKSHHRVENLNKSVDTAFTLLGLKAEDSGLHATQFFRSEVDTSKADEYKSSGPVSAQSMNDITDMMTALSEQQSSAYCTVARARTPPPVVVKVVKERKKVSTLAILMAKDRRQRGYGSKRPRRGAVPMAGKTSSKTLSEHAKVKKNCKK